ncbi:MAG: hypothetical protein ACYTG5_19460 [Planctomycetota bacterium]|jgi:hypothetical protein
MKGNGSKSLAIALGLVAFASCQSPQSLDFSELAEQPALPYAVRVTGGAFLDGPERIPGSPLSSTFAQDGVDAGEVLQLDDMVDALRSARVFSHVDADRSGIAFRNELSTQADALDFNDPEIREYLRAARVGGADYLLVIQGVQDAPVVDRGINDRWPATLALWLLVGLGAIIPDHSFETTATMEIALREVQTGQLIPGTRQELTGGPLELSLVSRGSSWWWLKMILIPPFWISSDEEEVAKKMREDTSRRLMFSMARFLKDSSLEQALDDFEAASATCVRTDSGLRIQVSAKESLSYLRLSLDSIAQSGPEFESFERALIASESLVNGAYEYGSEWKMTPPTGRLQILMQTVGGRVVSRTIELGDL